MILRYKKNLISQNLYLSIYLMARFPHTDVWLFAFSFSYTFQLHKLSSLTLCSLCIGSQFEIRDYKLCVQVRQEMNLCNLLKS